MQSSFYCGLRPMDDKLGTRQGNLAGKDLEYLNIPFRTMVRYYSQTPSLTRMHKQTIVTNNKTQGKVCKVSLMVSHTSCSPFTNNPSIPPSDATPPTPITAPVFSVAAPHWHPHLSPSQRLWLPSAKLLVAYR